MPADGRFKCRRCRHRYTFRFAWDALRLSERAKLKLLEYFVLGVPAYRLRFRGPFLHPIAEKFFHVIRNVKGTTEGTSRVNRLRCSQLQELNAGYDWSPDGGKTHPFQKKKDELPAGLQKELRTRKLCG